MYAQCSGRYVQCGNCICSVIYVKCEYSAPCCMIHYSDLQYGIYICTNLQYMFTIYWTCIANIPDLVGILVSSKYFVITWEVYRAVGCVLAHL